MKKAEKIKLVNEIKGIAKNYKVVGITNLYKLPTSSFQQIRKILKGNAIIKVAPKAVIEKVLESKEDWKDMKEKIEGYPALIFSNMDPFKLYKLIEKNKTPAPAKAGDIAPKDIEVKAGKTDLAPGPAITALQKLKIKTKVEGGKISILSDQIICKKGDVITEDIASVLNMLKIMPMEVGLNVVAICENGIVYDKEILHIDEEETIKRIRNAVKEMINISINTWYPTKETIEFLLIKAYTEMKSLSINAKIITKETIAELLALGEAEATALKSKINI
ncbi:MAG: 50S ribosomal protein L10 [Candidatus Aenigmatarchaeota archaeon]|nr:50S ribosomal protein L10 [Candidatus Aenigmarchaeota archaeon]